MKWLNVDIIYAQNTVILLSETDVNNLRSTLQNFRPPRSQQQPDGMKALQYINSLTVSFIIYTDFRLVILKAGFLSYAFLYNGATKILLQLFISEFRRCVMVHLGPNWLIQEIEWISDREKSQKPNYVQCRRDVPFHWHGFKNFQGTAWESSIWRRERAPRGKLSV